MKKIFLLFCFITTFTSIAQKFNVKEIKITDELIGDLYQASKNETIILIIPGSGPTDRNGNSVGIATNNSIKFLAESLAENKYNVFTYDKRAAHILKFQKEIPESNFQQGIDDAEIIIGYLKDKMKFKKVVIIGHSEGSLVGMIAAQKNAAAFVSLAGAGNSIDVIIAEQLNKQAPDDLKEEISEVLKSLKNGKKIMDINPMLASFFSEKNQSFLIEWMKFNPVEEIAKLKIPILIINGTKDIQASVTEAEILHKANPKSEIVIIKNMNHIFKVIENDEDNQKSYFNPDLPIDKELTTTICNFLKRNKL